MTRRHKHPGRPALPKSDRAVGVTVKVRRPVAAKFRAWCKAHDVSQARAFADWVAGLKV
jgi:hypothetical protein